MNDLGQMELEESFFLTRMLNSDNKHFVKDLPTCSETHIFPCESTKFTCKIREFKLLYQFLNLICCCISFDINLLVAARIFTSANFRLYFRNIMRYSLEMSLKISYDSENLAKKEIR